MSLREALLFMKRLRAENKASVVYSRITSSITRGGSSMRKAVKWLAYREMPTNDITLDPKTGVLHCPSLPPGSTMTITYITYMDNENVSLKVGSVTQYEPRRWYGPIHRWQAQKRTKARSEAEHQDTTEYLQQEIPDGPHTPV